MILHGNCLELMATMEPNSVDAIVTDPPYGLVEPRSGGHGAGKMWRARTEEEKVQRRGGFMGKKWDATGIERDPATWEACLRVLKPGGHLVAFSGTRTSHRMICAIEDAGFEIRDSLVWLYGSGFPKSLDVSKAIDKMAGAERQRIGRKDELGVVHSLGKANETKHEGWRRPWMDDPDADAHFVTAPATPEAEQWQGWHSALKPGHEPIVLARKPLAGKNIAANVLAYGTGAINVDKCRVEGGERPHIENAGRANAGVLAGSGNKEGSRSLGRTTQGRWPANVILDETAASLLDAMSGERKTGAIKPYDYKGGDTAASLFHSKRVTSTHEASTGGASRFFLTAPIDDPDAEHLRFAEPKNPNPSEDFMVQYDCNCETTEGGKWEKQGHQASTQAASDTPPQRDTTASTSGTGNEAALSWHTSLNGNSTTDLSPTDSRFTTATATSKTTASRTCNCSMPSHTSAFTQDANSATANGGSLAASAENSNPSPLITGISVEKDGRSTDDAVPAISEKSLLINSGDVTRFAYVPKASRAERSAGLNTPSNHPTVKPLALMRWLVRLVTPPGGVVLDPFTGSGSTGCAAALEGFDFIGIEQDAEYVEIARARIAHWTPKAAPQLALALETVDPSASKGRWPANVLLDETAAALLDEQSGETTSKRSMRGVGLTGSDQKVYGKGNPDFDTMRGHNDTGGASRYFFTAHADQEEAIAGD